jgi:hypothetical protein
MSWLAPFVEIEVEGTRAVLQWYGRYGKIRVDEETLNLPCKLGMLKICWGRKLCSFEVISRDLNILRDQRGDKWRLDNFKLNFEGASTVLHVSGG